VVNPTSFRNANTISSLVSPMRGSSTRRAGYISEAQVMGWLARFFLPYCHSDQNHDGDSKWALLNRQILRTGGNSCLCDSLPLGSVPAQAERIKDLASVQGVRNNQLVGYGLVVGLDGTGDQTTQTPFTTQASSTCWRNWERTCRRRSRCS
jgi:hypothetical protein